MDEIRVMNGYKKGEVSLIYNWHRISDNDTLETIKYKEGDTIDVHYR